MITLVTYRDDRHALREHAEKLERELAATRAELERARGGLEQRRAPPAPNPESGIPLLVAAGLLLLLVALATPLPASIRITTILVVLGAGVWLVVLSRLIQIASPSEAIVVTGKRPRIVRGRRVLRMPLLEQAERRDIGVVRVPISVQEVRARDGRFSSFELAAHVRPDPAEPAPISSERVTEAVESAWRRLAENLTRSEQNRERAELLRDAELLAGEELGRERLELVALHLLELRPVEAEA
jgi:hypothetical protein